MSEDKHVTTEHGDCVHWCEQCRLEEQQRARAENAQLHRARLHRYVPSIKELSDEQVRCLQLAEKWLDGLHHLPRGNHAVQEAGPSGIRLMFFRGKSFSTYDDSYLTTLVILAHQMCVRAEIGSQGMNTVVYLHAREREGDFSRRHPRLESAMKVFEKSFGKAEFGGD